LKLREVLDEPDRPRALGWRVGLQVPCLCLSGDELFFQLVQPLLDAGEHRAVRIVALFEDGGESGEAGFDILDGSLGGFDLALVLGGGAQGGCGDAAAGEGHPVGA